MNWLGKLRFQKHNVHAKWHIVLYSVKDGKFYFLCKILNLLNSFAKSELKEFSIFLSILSKLELLSLFTAPYKSLTNQLLLSDFWKRNFFLLCFQFSGAFGHYNSQCQQLNCLLSPYVFRSPFVFQSMLNSLMSFFKEAEEVPQVETHWISESGIIDVFVLLGPKPHDVFQEYASYTGTTALPPVSIVEYIG